MIWYKALFAMICVLVFAFLLLCGICVAAQRVIQYSQYLKDKERTS